MSPAVAALCTGLAALAVAVLIATVAYGSARRRFPSRATETGREAELAAKLAVLVGRDTASLISAHPGRAGIAALALGFVVGASPHLREALRKVLK
jgi:hypothetical protein